jgi:hypothetical protein
MINSARKILIFSIIIFGLSSCQSVLMKIYGIKNPEIENKKTILKTANKYKLDTSNIVTVNGKEFPYFLNGRSIPNGSVYDKNGRYIEYRKSDTSCNAGLFLFIESLNLKDKYHQPDSADLNTELKKFRDLSGSNLKTLENADFIC